MFNAMSDEYTPDDKKVWKAVKKTVKPLSSNQYNTCKDVLEASQVPASKPSLSKSQELSKNNNTGGEAIKDIASVWQERQAVITKNAHSGLPGRVKMNAHEGKNGYREKGQGLNLNKNHRKKSMGGEIAPQCRLDLHGNSLDVAFRRTGEFFDQCWEDKVRYVNIITGKGAGILHSHAPQWFKGAFAEYISEWHDAPNRYGGSGAFIIVLKKQNKGK